MLGSRLSVGLTFGRPLGMVGLRPLSISPMRPAEPMSRMAEPTADDMAEAGVPPSCRVGTGQGMHERVSPCDDASQALAVQVLCYCGQKAVHLKRTSYAGRHSGHRNIRRPYTLSCPQGAKPQASSPLRSVNLLPPPGPAMPTCDRAAMPPACPSVSVGVL
jgi:hypothetical protein